MQESAQSSNQKNEEFTTPVVRQARPSKLASPYVIEKVGQAQTEETVRQTRSPLFLMQRGRIELIMGCMFAGKTTELLRRCNKHKITGKRVLRVKFSADKRYDNEFKISTHTGQQIQATPINVLSQLGDEWKAYNVIGIDEGQFFPDIVNFSEMAANCGKIVIISSLQGTFLRGAFPNILALLPKCEKIKKLTAICKLCKQNASFTFRTASKDCNVMIGGENMYMPLCRECHARESRINADNVFVGDPSKLEVELENKQFEKQPALAADSLSDPHETPKTIDNTPENSMGASSGSNRNSPNAKSFSSDDSINNENKEITLRKINTPAS